MTLGLGAHAVALSVDDGNGETSASETTVTVVDTEAPALACANDATLASAGGTGARPVALAPPAAADACGEVRVTSDAPAAFPPGRTTVTWTASDTSGNAATCRQDVLVSEEDGPAVSATVATRLLWPPNHKLVDVGLTVVASDPSGAMPGVELEVWADEPEDQTTGDGNQYPDAQIQPTRLLLRSERKGDGDGRVYLLLARATNESGQTAHSCRAVVAPHDHTQVSIDDVNAQAAAAVAHCTRMGVAPSGYFLLAEGAMTASPPDETVEPLLECVLANPDGTWAAVFGYRNDNAIPVAIAVGVENRFAPAPADRGQPSYFRPGRSPAEEGAFVVPFDGSALSWTVRGRTVSASASSSRCTAPPAAPVARDDQAATPLDTPVAIAVLANDTDPQGDLLSIARVTQPAHGLAVIHP
ncbi:MAG: HYR domain-containing protein, partial [Chloroflexi bacterium]|nr:HYR domain-containing protein [Chloroflexota bacterium]